MKFLREMATYHAQRKRYLYSGDRRFMQLNTDIFRKYDSSVRVIDQGDQYIEVTMELSEKQARALGAELEKADDKWAAEFDDYGYGGYFVTDE